MSGGETAPSISVVVNNYNYAPFLTQCLDSVLDQLHSGDELVVVDDDSSDDSLAILERYRKRGAIKLVAQENGGQMSAVRRGLNEASGELLVLLDSDDYLLGGYLERLREIYGEKPEVDFVFTRARVGGEDARMARKVEKLLARMELQPGIVGPTRWAVIMFHEFVGTPTSGLSFRKTLWTEMRILPRVLDGALIFGPYLKIILRWVRPALLKRRFYADGVLVRTASALGANKFYNHQAGYFYRIHGHNSWAMSPMSDRLIEKYVRNGFLGDVLQTTYRLDAKPTTEELCAEIGSRRFARRRRRWLHIRFNYCCAVLRSRGTLWQKIRGLGLASGLCRAGSSGPEPKT